MDSAIIGPIKYLNQLNQAFPTGFHVCYMSLAHQYKDYRDFYRSRSRRGEYIILDYSNVTPRDIPQKTSIHLMRPVIEYIKPSVVILPDSDLHLKKTVQSANDTVKYLRSRLGEVPVVGVVQGISEAQYGDCLETYKKISMDYPLKGLVLPSSMEKIIPRHQFITDIYKPCEFGLPIFISEVFDGLREPKVIASMDSLQDGLVQGGWTSMPARLAYKGKSLSTYSTIRPIPEPLTFLEDYIPDLMVENIESYLRIYNGRD